MRPLPVLWTVTIAAIVLAAGLVGGYELGRSSAPTPRGAPVAASTLSIIAAGTLGVPFGSVASLLVNTTPGISAPLASQQYEGSLSVMAAVAQLNEAFDVVASADYHLIPQQLESNWANWEVVFGTSPEALVYDPSVGALAGINTSNWPSKLLASGLPMGIANASTDPNGYNEIFVLELQGQQDNGSLSSLYDHFFTTPFGSLAIPNPTTTRVESESNVASLITSHAIASFITYRSYAVGHGLSFVDLTPAVGLGSTDAAALSAYANASTTIAPSTGSRVVHGAPVLFSVTVPRNAPNATLGIAFVNALLSPAGQALLAADGLTPVAPAWTDRPTALPPLLAVDAFLLPPLLLAQLPA